MKRHYQFVKTDGEYHPLGQPEIRFTDELLKRIFKQKILPRVITIEMNDIKFKVAKHVLVDPNTPLIAVDVKFVPLSYTAWSWLLANYSHGSIWMRVH